MMYINKALRGFFNLNIPKNISTNRLEMSEQRYELQEWVWVSQKHSNPRMRKIQVWVTYGWCYKYEAIPDICFTNETHRAIESATGNLVIKRK